MTYLPHDEHDAQLREQDNLAEAEFHQDARGIDPPPSTPSVSDRDLAIRRLRTQMAERIDRIEATGVALEARIEAAKVSIEADTLALVRLVEDYIERERAA